MFPLTPSLSLKGEGVVRAPHILFEPNPQPIPRLIAL